MNRFDVSPGPDGNLIQFNTGMESHSLGFNVYREAGGQRTKLNPSLLAGTALMADTKFHSGYSHSWLDAGYSSGASSYFVEEIDIRGKHTWYGPVSPTPGAARRSPGVRGIETAMLRDVGRKVPVGNAGAGAENRVATLQFGHGDFTPFSPDNQNVQFGLAAGHGIKVGVPSAGWYVLSEPDLIAAGLDPNADPRSLQLYANGVEVPIMVNGGSQGKLDASSTVEFYGQGLDTIYSGTQEYWLVSGNRPGRRIPSQNSRSTGSSLTSFPSTLEWQPRTLYFAALLNGDKNNMFGPALVAGAPVSQVFNLTNRANPGGASPLRVILQGATAGPHSVSVQLNGSTLGTVNFSDMDNYSSTLMVPNAAFVDGANTLTLSVLGGDSDVSVVDTVDLTYPHTYTADGNQLQFSAGGRGAVTVGGFSTNLIRVVDVTDPGNVVSVVGNIHASGGGYAVSLGAPGEGVRTFLAFTDATTSRPSSMVANHPSSLHAEQAGADMVVISHGDFVSSLGPLVSLRQSQGHTVSVVNIDDIYDEFNFGNKSPYAIKSFLSAAKSVWATKPHWVLLAGDATFDPRNYLGSNLVDYVPTKLIDTALNETSSDDWFVDFNNDGLPDMAIGRLLVTTPAQTAAMISKIAGYEAASGGWKTRALLVSNANDPDINFTGYTAAVQALLPHTVAVTDLSVNSDPSAGAHLLSDLNSGVGLVNYIGHGSTDIWANGLFDSTQALALTNGSAAPFVIDMTCLNGYFQDIYETTLGKALVLAPNGGAAAVWASSALTDASPQSDLNQGMIKALYGSQPLTLGEAAALAKQSTTDMDVRRTWILFGDPAMKFR